jgi:hypothetical protein
MTDLGAEGLIASLKLERRSARMTTTVVGLQWLAPARDRSK